MKNLLLFSILVGFLLSATSCKKAHIADPDTNEVKSDHLKIVPMDPEMVEYFASPKAGTKFIYVEETTGEIDTVSVISKKSSYNRSRWILPDTTVSFEAWEGISVRYQCQKTEDFDVGLIIRSAYHETYNFRVRQPIGGHISHIVDKRKGEFVQYQTPYGLTPVQIEKMEVNGVEYSDIVHIIGETSTLYRDFWFARNVGIIKRISLHPYGEVKVWHLQEIIHP